MAMKWFIHGLHTPTLWCISSNLYDCHISHRVPPSQSWAHWAVLLGERCGRCPARSHHGWIQIRFCTASSHGGRRSGQSFSFESESSHLHLSPYHKKPENKNNVCHTVIGGGGSSLCPAKMDTKKTCYTDNMRWTYTELRCTQKLIFGQFVLARDLVVLAEEWCTVIYGFWRERTAWVMLKPYAGAMWLP